MQSSKANEIALLKSPLLLIRPALKAAYFNLKRGQKYRKPLTGLINRRKLPLTAAFIRT
jgi:hypothetical protein